MQSAQGNRYARASIIKAFKEGSVEKVSHRITATLIPSINDTEEYPIKIMYTTKGGMHAIASRDIRKGTVVLKECPIALAIDEHNATKFCNCCASKLTPLDNRIWKRNHEVKMRLAAEQPDSNQDTPGNDMSSPLCESCSANNYIVALNNFFHSFDVRIGSANTDNDSFLYRSFFRLFMDYSGVRANSLPDDVLCLESQSVAMLAADLCSTELGDLTDDIRHLAFIIHTILSANSDTEISQSDIELACNILVCNQHAIMHGDKEIGRALCPVAALMNHSCAPNLRWEISADTNGIMIYTAAMNISIGEELTIAYLNPKLLPQEPAKRLALMASKRNFICGCVRCKDHCLHCGKGKSKLVCVECRCASYCSQECLKMNSSAHSVTCKHLQSGLQYFK